MDAARGRPGPESDIDIVAVVQPDDQRAALETRVVDSAFDVDLEFNVFISRSVVTPDILIHPMWRETREVVTAQDVTDPETRSPEGRH